ncbi:MAG TPA: hypothetical protein VHO01_01420 [Jatrophihabitans sp.]|nr:hypothetical protein [Jatrophihabitans sp.]
MEEEIYLDPAAPPAAVPAGPGRPRRRWIPLLAGALVLAVVALVQQHRTGHAHPAAPVAQPVTGKAVAVQPWPRLPGVSGSSFEAPIVSSDPLAEPVQAQLPVAGTRPGLLDVARGSVQALPGMPTLSKQQYVSQVIAAGGGYYSLVRTCQQRAVGTVIFDRPGRPQQRVAVGHTFYRLLSDGRGGVWGEMYSDAPPVRPEAALGTSLLRLDQPGKTIPIPPSLLPIGLYAGTLVTSTVPDPVRSTLILLDLRTGRTRNLGPSFGASVSRGLLVWTPHACSDVAACTVQRLDLATGQGSAGNYHLPLESNFGTAVLSPDRHKIAFVLQRETNDPGYLSQASGTPADLAVLDLRTGVIDPVPNLELAPNSAPSSLTFSPDGTWLIVAFTTATGTDVYSWRSPLARPARSPQT